ncbi:MAG: transcription termination factor Rho [Solirubrobacteraceae bacterium]|nr:transcription termination factor Rho [Solirubrobacteraceae bacterium]
MPVLTRSALDASPLADLHALASTLGIDGFRRLRKADLADAILERQGGGNEEEETAVVEPAPPARPARTPRRRRSAAARTEVAEAAEDRPDVEEPAAAPDSEEPEAEAEPAPRAPRARRSSRTRRDAEERPAAAAEDRVLASAATASGSAEGEESATAEGVVELLANGSGFLRVSPPDQSDDDVYISAAQARRCELVSGDRVGGPVRRARRSERHPSLIRVATINGVAADDAVRGTRLEDLEADFPSLLLPLGDDDPTLAAIGFYAPIGRGSRVVLAGAARSGKTEAVKRLAGALAGIEDLELEVLLVGIRPEELSEWKESAIATVSGLSFASPAESQASAVEQAIERGRRIAARGGDAVLLIDTLEGLHPPVARRALAAARKIREGGSLTVIGTAERPQGGETTVVVFDAARVARGHLPAVDPIASGTVRAELLVGLEGYQAIAKARSKA